MVHIVPLIKQKTGKLQKVSRFVKSNLKFRIQLCDTIWSGEQFGFESNFKHAHVTAAHVHLHHHIHNKRHLFHYDVLLSSVFN